MGLLKKYLKKYRKLDFSDKLRIIFLIIMQFGFISALIFAILENDWLSAFIAVVALLVVWLPRILNRRMSVHYPLSFEFILNLFVFASIFLGELHGFYTKFWWWDVVLHAGAGVSFGFIGFLILFTLYRSGKLDMQPGLLVLFSFCFGVAAGAVWEIFEYFMDSTFGFNMQKTGLRDTMWDLIVDMLGALIVSISGYYYLKNRRKKAGKFYNSLNSYFVKKDI